MDTTPAIEAEPVPVIAAEMSGGSVRLTVPATACTERPDFLPRTRRSQAGGGAVQLVLTRARPDRCPDRPAGALQLGYQLREIGLLPEDRVRVLNPFLAGADAAPPPSGISLGVAPNPASPGDNMALKLRNQTGARVGYNLCFSKLERRGRTGWISIPLNHVCPAILMTMEPGREATSRMKLPLNLADGYYRFRIEVESPLGTREPQQSIYGTAFQVRR